MDGWPSRCSCVCVRVCVVESSQLELTLHPFTYFNRCWKLLINAILNLRHTFSPFLQKCFTTMSIDWLIFLSASLLRCFMISVLPKVATSSCGFHRNGKVSKRGKKKVWMRWHLYDTFILRHSVWLLKLQFLTFPMNFCHVPENHFFL